MGFNVSSTVPLTFTASATEGAPPCPPSPEKKPLLPPGGVGLGSNVIAQMKRRHTKEKDVEGDKESKEQVKGKDSSSEPAEVVAAPKDDIAKPAKVEGKGKWNWNSDEAPSSVGV